MSKLRIFILFAALLAFAAAFAACGEGGDGGSADAVLDEATLQGVKSGDLDLSLAFDSKGSEGGKVDVSLSGPFQSEGEGQPPRLDLTAKANGTMDGEDIDFEGGLFLLPNKAYVNYEGIDYEVDPTTFSFVKSTIEEEQKRSGGESSGITACQEAVGELQVSDFAENLVDDGSGEVGGTKTTKVSGDLDVSGAIDAVVQLTEEPACQAQLEAAGSLPSGSQIEDSRSQIEDAVKSAHVEVEVGDDDIVRRIAAQLALEPESSGSGPESADVDFELTLTGVNEDQSFVAPKNTKPLSGLFVKLGINPLDLLGSLSGEGGLSDLLKEAGDSGSGGGQSYTDCLQSARNAADIQKCGSKLR